MQHMQKFIRTIGLKLLPVDKGKKKKKRDLKEKKKREENQRGKIKKYRLTRLFEL